MNPHIQSAQIRLPSPDLKEDMPFFIGKLGFRLDQIFPADDPAVAVLSGYGLCLRLERGASEPAGTLRLLCDNPFLVADGAVNLTAPNGTHIELVQANPELVQPPTQHSFAVRRLKDSSSWVIGRAGMRYRDLIPDRLGGSIIASHIRIPDGGPVPDMVHYHTIGFQLIFCYRGWVDLVYEDQGPPFRLHANDCVIQPPEIRHKVLFASDNVEVIEIGVPAEHVTTIDHDMTLPNERIDRSREWQGTQFVHHKNVDSVWKPWRIDGFEARDTGIAHATKGIAGVQVARPLDGFKAQTTQHDTDILFTFVKEGRMVLQAHGHAPKALEAGDAFVIPPCLATTYSEPSSDCELLEVALAANFMTKVL